MQNVKNSSPVLQHQAPPNVSILRIQSVIAKTGHARSTIYKMLSEGTFPRPVGLGSRAIGWKSSDIDNYIASLTVRGAQNV